MTTTDTNLTHVQVSAYLHLIDFGKGAEVAVRVGTHTWSGVVTIPQRDDGDDITAAYLTVTRAGGVEMHLTVAGLLAGEYQIEGWDDAVDGHWTSFASTSRKAD